MITTITGTLKETAPTLITLENNGLGYEIHIPLSTSQKLPKAGENLTLQTHLVYREDSQTLYGFSTRQERDFFRLIVEKVSGIGPKIALNILSRIPLSVLRIAISTSDLSVLTECPGIGKKTAERLIIELRDKIFPGKGNTPIPFSPDEESGEPNIMQDACAALISLGYKPNDAEKSITKALKGLENPTTETLIKRALDF